MDAQRLKHRRQLRRRNHVRRNITGTSEKPRLSVFRSSKHIYAQLIDDLNGVTLASASTSGKSAGADMNYGGNVKAAQLVGKKLAEAALAKGIKEASFDRGHYRFHGRVRALAVAATEAGLKCTGLQKPEPKPDETAPVEAKKETKPAKVKAGK